MNKGNLNKLVTNYPVSLTNEEVENLSLTLSAVRTAGGGGGEGKTYTGVGFVSVNNTNNTISLTTEADEKLNQPLPTKVSDLTDSANYQTTAGMASYETTQHASQTYLTKSSADNDYAPLSTTADIDALKAVSGDFSLYYKKTETSSKEALETAFESKQDNLTQEQLSAISSVSSIKGTILTGDSNILATSAEDGNNIKWTLQLTAQPTVTDTTLSGYDGIVATKDSTVSSQWNVGIAQAYKEQIEAVSSKLTQDDADTLYAPISVTGDVDTLKSSSADWNKISAKLNTSAFSTVSGNFLIDEDLYEYAKKSDLEIASGELLTTAQYQTDSATFLTAVPDTYALKSDIPTTVAQLIDSGNYYQKTETSSKTELSTEFAKYQVTGDYATKSDISDMATKTWVDEQSFYTKASGDNDYAPKSVTATINTLTGASAGWNEVTAKLDASVAAQTYLTTSTYANDSATFVTSSSDTITGTKQYALTTTGWAEVQVGASLTASSGINIDNNLINVKLGRNLKFDTYSSVTTEDNIRISSVRAGEYDNQYTIVNKYGLETYFSSAPDSAKLTLTTNGLNNTLVGGNRCITANYDLNHLFFKSYDNIGTYSGDYSQVEIKVMQETAPEATQHRSSITLTDYYEGVEHTGLITVEKIAQWDQGGGTSFTGVTAAGSISGDGLTNPLGLKTSAEQALTSVSNKVDKPDTTQTVLNNNYLIYSTLSAEGATTGWMPLSANYYSKSEANGTFVATAFIDTTTLSGNGKSVSTKLGVKTDVIATKDYVDSSFLPSSGGTVSGELVVSAATGTFDNSYVKCVNDGNAGYSRFGVGSYGGAVIKAVNVNNNVQVNVKYNANNNELIQVQKNGTDIGFLIPAVTSTTTAGLTNDGILHIILES